MTVRLQPPMARQFHHLFGILVVLVVLAFKHAAHIQTSFSKATTIRNLGTMVWDEIDSPQRQETDAQDEGTRVDDEPLNIVLFYADDWTMKVLGKLNKYVKTPNIDTMADNGILFTNNCVTTSMCWISRATMVTGTYASRHLYLEPWHTEIFETHPWNETVFPLLKANGYYTGLVGKWHALEREPEMSMAFD